jgi:shikimate kinase
VPAVFPLLLLGGGMSCGQKAFTELLKSNFVFLKIFLTEQISKVNSMKKHTCTQEKNEANTAQWVNPRACKGLTYS